MNPDFLRLLSEMTRSPVNNYVVPGLTSSLVGGEGKGSIRLFTNDRDTREWITPHSHRFDFACQVLEGDVENILFVLDETGEAKGSVNLYAEGVLSPVDGGLGKYNVHHGDVGRSYIESRQVYGTGEIYSMRATEIHSIRFSRGAKVLFFEGPNVSTSSVFLEPFSNGRTVETFETKKWMFKALPDGG
jgi:hypothetical protein